MGMPTKGLRKFSLGALGLEWTFISFMKIHWRDWGWADTEEPPGQIRCSAILSKDPHREMTSVYSVIYAECLVGSLPLRACSVIDGSPLCRAVKIKCPFIQRCIGEMRWAFGFQTRERSLEVEVGGQKNLRWLSSLEGWIEFTQDREREEWRMHSDFRNIKREASCWDLWSRQQTISGWGREFAK